MLHGVIHTETIYPNYCENDQLAFHLHKEQVQLYQVL